MKVDWFIAGLAFATGLAWGTIIVLFLLASK